MSNVGVSVRGRIFCLGQMLMVTERMVGGLVNLEPIEEMDKELTEVIEDFDRAVNVEALRLAKENGKQSPCQPGHGPY